MSFKVEEFRSAMNRDGARPNLFSVSMNLPSFVVGGGGPVVNAATATNSAALTAADKLQFTAKSAQIPGSTLGTIVVPYFGRELKFAGNRTFPEWTITVINDEDFLVRKAFESWSNAINSHQTNIRSGQAYSSSGAQSRYTEDATVIQYGKKGDTLRSYKFVGMFPIDVSPIDLDWGNNDVIEEFTVTFAYQYWEDATLETTPRTAPQA